MDSAAASYYAHCVVGVGLYITLVTKDPDEAAKWVLGLRPLHFESQKVIGISFSWAEQREPDGYTVDKVQSIHLSHGASALVYYLGSGVQGRCSPEVSAFLANPDNIFIGMDVAAGFHVLRIKLHNSTRSRVIDLWEAARMCGVLRKAVKFSVGFPVYAAMAEAILNDVNAKLLRRLDPLWESWMWPPSAGQVECAVQTAVVFHQIGLAAVSRNCPPI